MTKSECQAFQSKHESGQVRNHKEVRQCNGEEISKEGAQAEGFAHVHLHRISELYSLCFNVNTC